MRKGACSTLQLAVEDCTLWVCAQIKGIICREYSCVLTIDSHKNGTLSAKWHDGTKEVMTVVGVGIDEFDTAIKERKEAFDTTHTVYR